MKTWMRYLPPQVSFAAPEHGIEQSEAGSLVGLPCRRCPQSVGEIPSENGERAHEPKAPPRHRKRVGGCERANQPCVCVSDRSHCVALQRARGSLQHCPPYSTPFSAVSPKLWAAQLAAHAPRLSASSTWVCSARLSLLACFPGSAKHPSCAVTVHGVPAARARHTKSSPKSTMALCPQRPAPLSGSVESVTQIFCRCCRRAAHWSIRCVVIRSLDARAVHWSICSIRRW